MARCKDVIILGLDVHGKECADIIKRRGDMRLTGFVSQLPEHPADFGGYPVLGGEDALDYYPQAGLIPLHVWKSTRHIDRWVSLIDPTVFIASTADIGRGCVIFPQCFIGASAVLGDGVLLLAGSVVNHDCRIDDRVVITTQVKLAGGVKVGGGAYLGQGCNIRQNLSVGPNAVVGMGAVVVKNVPEAVTVAGNPAKELPPRR